MRISKRWVSSSRICHRRHNSVSVSSYASIFSQERWGSCNSPSRQRREQKKKTKLNYGIFLINDKFDNLTKECIILHLSHLKGIKLPESGVGLPLDPYPRTVSTLDDKGRIRSGCKLSRLRLYTIYTDFFWSGILTSSSMVLSVTSSW